MYLGYTHFSAPAGERGPEGNPGPKGVKVRK